MKKKQVEMMFVDQVKRKNKIIGYVCAIMLVSIIALTFLFLYLNRNRSEYVKYTEKSDLNYSVYLKNNDFFDKTYLEKDNQYIANLINYIKAEFNYNLSVEEKNIGYKYSYRIEADVTVKDSKTKRNIYHYVDELEKSDYIDSHSTSKVNINHSLNIDYNKYNNLIKKFNNMYDLDDIESVLNVNMYVSVLGDCEEVEDSNKDSIITLSIPLTTKTVGIDMKYDLVDENDVKLMKCNEKDIEGYIYIVVCMLFTLVDIALIIVVIKYAISTRTAESIYDRELKKILNNYRSYIQKINNSFSLRGYQVLKVDTFTDMLEIRDTINEPILMIESSEKTGAFFIIPSKTKILYTFSLKVNDIRKKMEEKKDEEF